MTVAAVILCADAECRRTLKAAIAAVTPVADDPPPQGEWLLVAEEKLLTDYTLAWPPRRMLVLGETLALPGVLENIPVERVALPFRLSALLSRLHGMAVRPMPLLAGSALVLDASARLLTDTEIMESVELTEKETRLLEVLVLAAGLPVEKDRLLAEVWATAPEVTTRTLETHLSRLRAKLQQFPAPVAVVPEAGGYRLTCL